MYALARVAYIYGDELLSYDFGRGHPLRPERPLLCKQILLSRGILPEGEVVAPRKADASEAALFHTQEYLSRIREASESGEGLLDAGDTPAFKGCFEASLAIVGATLRAIELVESGEFDHAVNFAGGLHHARRDAASGFCIMNDCSIGIARLKARYKRIAYVDIDAHHGDGVVYGFYSDPGLLTVDVHQDGRTLFPGTGDVYETGGGEGRGRKLNIPLPPGSGDDVLIHVAERIIVPALEMYAPEFVLMQCGADGLEGDPLTRLRYSAEGCTSVVRLVHEASHRIGAKMVLLGGGGYNAQRAAECWASEFAAIKGLVGPPGSGGVPGAGRLPITGTTASGEGVWERVRVVEASLRSLARAAGAL